MTQELLPEPDVRIDDGLKKYADITVHADVLSLHLHNEGLTADQIERSRILFTDFIEDKDPFCITHGTYNSVDGVTVSVLGSLLLLGRKQAREMNVSDFSHQLTAQTQKTLVHELRHLTDDVKSRGTYDPEKLEDELRRLRRRSDRRLGAAAISGVPLVTGSFIENAVPTNYILPAALFLGVSALSHIYLVKGGDHRAYLKSPSEVSARSAADNYTGEPLVTIAYKAAAQS